MTWGTYRSITSGAETVRAAPSIAPSNVAHFLQVQPQFETTFLASQFAAYFWLTAKEAAAVLSGFCSDGLLTCTGASAGIEVWQPTTDGRYVFGKGRPGKRIKKKELESALLSLKVFAELNLNEDITEISAGGRPINGKDSGQLLVGIKTTQSPFSVKSHETLVASCLRMLAKHLPEDSFVVMLFDELIPERLAHRTIIGGPRNGDELATPETLIDRGECMHLDALASLGRQYGVQDVTEAIQYMFLASECTSNGLDYSVSWMIYNELEKRAYPVRALPGKARFNVDTDSLLEGRVKHRAMDLRFGAEGGLFDAAAEIDYLATTGQLNIHQDRLKEKLITDYRTPRWFHYVEEDISLLVLVALQRIAINARRFEQERMRVTNIPTKHRYLVLFDCLNMPIPCPMGMVKITENKNSALRSIETLWGRAVAALDNPAGILAKNGFNAGYLSVFERDATPDEIEVYEKVCRKAGGGLKGLLLVGQKAFGITSRFGGSKELTEVPPSLLLASPNNAVRPKFLDAYELDNHRRRPSLEDVIDEMPEEWKSRAKLMLLDVRTISMRDFVIGAARNGSKDRLVLGLGLCEEWLYHADADGWAVQIGTDEWVVRLEATGGTLLLNVFYGRESITLQLAPPAAGEQLYGRPYEGKFSSLWHFLRNLDALHRKGVLFTMERHASDSHADLNVLESKRAESFASMVRSMLDWHGEGDLTYWPHFDFS